MDLVTNDGVQGHWQLWCVILVVQIISVLEANRWGRSDYKKAWAGSTGPFGSAKAGVGHTS